MEGEIMTDDVFAHNLGLRLKEIREELLGLTLRNFSKLLEIPQFTTFRRYETGERIIGGKLLFKINQLGISIDWFLTGKGPVYSSKKKFLKIQAEIKDRRGIFKSD